ncbi:hypothetical protein [Actinomyces sp.]|uniref:hypothetical protein n=1 Tax=Actinomyces sp. TaxID=29317 RepID=UPI0026DCEFD8|nr:hypothetical protein [Actinomyces sp.]MDO4900375.1 hypothetical protein [Actinomyces sp.]
MYIEEILAIAVGSMVIAVIAFRVSRRRYRKYLMARAAVGGTITDAALLNALRAIIRTVTTAVAGAMAWTVVLPFAHQFFTLPQTLITCGAILLLSTVLAWIYGRYAVLAELARTRHLELPQRPWLFPDRVRL